MASKERLEKYTPIYIPNELVAQVEELARDLHLNRTPLTRLLITEALEARNRKREQVAA